MKRSVIRRDELLTAKLDLGSLVLPLEEFSTTGFRAIGISPSGGGKTSLGLLIGEQLADQGWVSVLVDPEGEIASLYGEPVADEDELARLLKTRERSIVVVSAIDASDFLRYGEVILAAAEQYRKPIYLFLDEGQVFSSAKVRKNDLGEASDIVDDFMQRGRKRCLDIFITAQRFAGTLSRAVFASKTLTFIGRQEDPTAWNTLSMQFRGTGLGYQDVAALSPGDFFCFSRRGCEKVTVPMAKALAKVAIRARVVKPALPKTFTQWDQAMAAIPTRRLEALTGPIVGFLTSVAGLSAQQALSGTRALRDELEARL